MKYLFNLLALVFLLGACGKEEAPEKRNYFAEAKSVNKLGLARMSISKMATIDDLRLEDARGMRQTAAAVIDMLKIGDRKGAYSYNTYLRAYVDLSALRPEDVVVDEAAGRITVTLPPVQTEFLGRDVGMQEDHYRVSGLRSAIDSRERSEIKEQLNTLLKGEVEKNPAFRQRLESDGRNKARLYFESLLGGDGYDVVVLFKDGAE